MLAYTIRRILLMIPTLFGVAVLVFFMLRVMPGDIVETMLREGAGNIPQHVIEQERARLGLDRPLYVQFFSWFGGILQGDDIEIHVLKCFCLLLNHAGKHLAQLCRQLYAADHRNDLHHRKNGGGGGDSRFLEMAIAHLYRSGAANQNSIAGCDRPPKLSCLDSRTGN